jgi:C4-dicarboxylate-specific signal transduction histidine kinase
MMGDYGRIRVRRRAIVEASPERCHRAWVELEDLLRDAMAELRGRAARKRLALRLSMPPDLPLVRGDAEQLLQFFAALFSAAIDSTPDGGQISLDLEQGDGCTLVLSIAGAANDGLCDQIGANVPLFAPFGTLEIDIVAAGEAHVSLRWRRERWRVRPPGLCAAAGFW